MKSHMLSNKKRPYNNSNQVYLFITILNYLSINLSEYLQKIVKSNRVSKRWKLTKTVLFYYE